MTKRKKPEERKPRGRRHLDGSPATVVPVDPKVNWQVKVLASQKAWVEQEAKRQGINASELIRRWIEEKQAAQAK